MPNPFTNKAKKKANPFAVKAKGKSVSDGDKPNAFTAKARGEAPARKQPKPVRHEAFWPPEAYDPPEPRSSWEATQRKKEARENKLSDKEDFVHNGMRYCHVRKCDGGFWRCEVHNGDKVYVFHNRYGSFMADYGDNGSMVEPARINIDVFAIRDRVVREWERRGLNPLTGKPFPPPEEKKPRKAKQGTEPDKPKANAFTAKAKKGAKK